MEAIPGATNLVSMVSFKSLKHIWKSLGNRLSRFHLQATNLQHTAYQGNMS